MGWEFIHKFEVTFINIDIGTHGENVLYQIIMVFETIMNKDCQQMWLLVVLFVSACVGLTAALFLCVLLFSVYT